MATGEWLAERFEEHRAHLRAVAYRMLGSVSEAEERASGPYPVLAGGIRLVMAAVVDLPGE